MKVSEERHFASQRFALGFPAVLILLSGAALGILPGARAHAQMPNPSSAANPFWGSVTVEPVTGGPLTLTLDGAVERGLKNNLGLKEAQDAQKVLEGEKNEALQEFLPSIELEGDTGYHMLDLAALGFSPKVVSKFSSLFGGKTPTFSPITRWDLTEGQLRYSEILFSGPVIEGWKAAKAAERSSYFGMMSARGEVVQQVATTYLRAVADSGQVDNAKALVDESQVLLDHEQAAKEAGTAANLDVLRAQVQLQTQQQALIVADNRREKDLILLRREIGLHPDQAVTLIDQSPYNELAAETPEEVRALAYKSRQDYQNLQNQAVEYKAAHAVYRSERLPTLSFQSYYGTSTVNGAGTHGNFLAMGELSFPIFREAKLRGDADVAKAQMQSVNAQLEDLRNHIDEQVRAALLDVNANQKLVDVARSNVDLAKRALSDETDRVNAGVDDNLPLVTAQATLAKAESSLVESVYQYNVSKIALARAAGVLETQYRAYLGQ